MHHIVHLDQVYPYENAFFVLCQILISYLVQLLRVCLVGENIYPFYQLPKTCSEVSLRTWDRMMLFFWGL